MLVLKGFIIGLGKIIPGVSGSLIAISLGVYESAIESLVNLKQNYKKNITYLGCLGLGILLAIIGFSKVILFCLNHFYLYTMFLFIGLMMGNIPISLKKIKYTKKRNWLYFLISILLVYIVYQLKLPTSFIPTKTFQDSLIVFLLGNLDAFTMIVPGISGTALFMMINCYEFIISLFSNPFGQIYFALIFGFGSFIGIIFTSFLMNYLFKNYKDIVHLIILGFTITSLFVLLKPLILNINIYNILPICILWISGFLISLRLEKLS